MTSPSVPDVPVVQTSSSSEIVVIKGRKYRQRPLGPAPFASFEDLSDELDSPPETARVTLPGIKEDPSSQLQSPSTPLPQVTTVNLTEKEEQGLKDALKSSLIASAPPRIDISRASSSSQHEDSITSSPDRENDTHNLGYKEDGTVDLRSSTEELDYIQEPGTVEESEEKRKRERMLKRQQQVRNFGDTQSVHELMERKDSSCSVMSDVGLLCISGRTSRLSSIGSAASGGSVASGVSHLSTGSHLSGRSTRSPSPHKMLLETSFCGSKPVHPQGSVTETSATVEKQHLSERSGSRPPSSLRSRSPSPHKMLLETSFCGTKQMSATSNQDFSDSHQKKKRKVKPTPTVVTEAEIVSQKIQQSESLKTAEVFTSEREGNIDAVESEEKLKKSDQIKRKEKTDRDPISTISKPKSIALPKLEKKSTKPKKVISLRDLPVDEIYIPLKGPELDFEEIIRKASPNPKKKIEEKPTCSADEIFIPLRSPTESEKELQMKRVSPRSSTMVSVSKGPSKPVTERQEKKTKRETAKVRQYEVCEDGSIIIPLHSPDENKKYEEFETEGNKNDRDLDESQNMSDWKAEEETQSKPATLDLSESGLNTTTWLSQALPPGKSEMVSGGSRTPSPGSSLSRKSSFANLFRKSEVTGSPDSQGGISRKKSGPLTGMLKDASDGLRDRSKSRDRHSVSSAGHSPSGKKNVFSNLFGKKKTETKVTSGKDSGKESDFGLDLHQVKTNKNTAEEGDYIIIPLRDPSDPPASLVTEDEESYTALDKTGVTIAATITTKSTRASNVSETVDDFAASNPIKGSPSEGKKTILAEETKIMGRKSSSGSLKIKQSSDMCSEEISLKLETSVSRKDWNSMSASALRQDEKEVEVSRNYIKSSSSKSSEIGALSDTGERVQESGIHTENFRISGEEKHFTGTSLDQEKVLNGEEGKAKEEVVTVTADGIRKLKLPPEPGDLEDDHERKGLVYQESFEDELPYVPTTLPQERSLGVPIVPVKQRMTEIKTCPIERPRSTTPINPTTLEDFVSSGKESAPSVNVEEKMKISLPRDDSITSKNKSPRRFSAKGKSWFEFAEEGLQSPRDQRKSSLRTSPSPPPLPPTSSPPSVLSTSAPPTASSWINFEELPEKRKQPKRITTVPAHRNSDDGGNLTEKPGPSGTENVVYNYVSPEDCQCECHDHNTSHHANESKKGMKLPPQLEVNNKFIKTRPANKSITDVSEGDSEKSECKYCEVGHTDIERDAEERPLLEGNSDVENDDSSSKKDEDEYNCEKIEDVDDEGWDAIRFGSNMKREKSGHISDSSGEFVSHENLHETSAVMEPVSTKPFGMDLHVGSNHSSLASQDEVVSPEERHIDG
ncbi:hypothetical protein RUM44_010282 [Polyplax serrata]|uniref:Uncharacterized protein n=1 Tax=Polyplax serrata TaxID=468196 RepID=A0ABR1AWL3_POLSC